MTPQDGQAEKIVIGAMLTSAAAIEAVTDLGLTSGDFAEPHHGLIYAYITSAYAAEQPTDPVAITKRLSDAGAIGGMITPVYLVECVQAVPLVTDAGHYASMVLGAADQRRIAVAAERLARIAEVGDAVKRAELVDQVRVELETTGPAGDDWAPVDLGPYLRGEVVQPEPQIGLRREDGLAMLYAGREHAVIGEMESGKSWYSAAACLAEIRAGNPVVYMHFEESDPGGTAQRLIALGASPTTVMQRFRFVAPTSKVTGAKLAKLLRPAPTLVVLDGVNEAMALHGWPIREEEGAAAFRQHLVRPCLAAGAATLACDHVVKNRDARDRYGLGSIHKGNGLSGSLILLETAEPFGRGLRGRSHVYVTKDRPGYLRRHGRATKLAGKTFLGELVVDDTHTRVHYLDLMMWAPRDDDEEEAPGGDDPHAQLDAAVLTAVDRVEAAQMEATTRTIRAAVKGRDEAVRDSLERLRLAGKVSSRPGSRRSTVWARVVPDSDLQTLDLSGSRFPPKGGGTVGTTQVVPGTTGNHWEPLDQGHPNKGVR
jgi:hypothetical protein